MGEKGTYLTSAFNLTSNLKLQIKSGTTLQGTERNEDNCGAHVGKDGHLGHCQSNALWPVLPWPEYPSRPSRNLSPPNLATSLESFQSWIRSYNASNIEIFGGGIIHGGGRWWWCSRLRQSLEVDPHSAPKYWRAAHALPGCDDDIKNGRVPSLGLLVPPRMIHIVESSFIHIHNVTIEFSPFWTVHFQYSSNILVEDNYIFNPNNGTFCGPNGDGIDMDSSRDAVVRNNVLDVSDDALCVKSGMDWLGRRAGGCNAAGECVGRPTENVLFTDNEVRNGHGLTIGSDAAGGVRNVTFKNIFLNGLGGPQAPGRRGAGVGGVHFKTQRGRGGVWEDITWDNIYGTHSMWGIAFSELHDGPRPPTNATATPVIRNMIVKNVVLSATGGSSISTLAESPIENLILSNITITPATRGAKIGWQCFGKEGIRSVNKVFATGEARNVKPSLGHCIYPRPSDSMFFV